MSTSLKQYIHILLLLCFCCSTDAKAEHSTSVSCLPDQASSLLQLKHSFVDVDRNLASWQPGRDCCYWKGVTCDMASGRVVSLDLSEFNLESSHLDPALFNLTSLRNLSLASNYFNEANLPSYGFERLTDIVHLNFSDAGFLGQIPIGIARLKKLVSLDFYRGYGMYLREPNFQTFMANLSNLRELRLDEVDISSGGSTWSVVLANYVPQLQILSLFHTGISGPIHPSFSRLRSLKVINLGSPNYLKGGLTGKVPEIFAELSSLTLLDISNNYLEGQFPTKVFSIKSLRSLDLSGNLNLSVCLPDFPVENDLETLNLAGSTLSCDILPSFTNLTSLKNLGLSTTGDFKGGSLVSKLLSLNRLSLFGVKPVSSWVGNLKHLVSLELNGYDFSELVPSWIGNLTSLDNLEIHNCNFSGPVPYQISNLANLTSLYLYGNNNNGQSVPSWIGNLTKLTMLLAFSCNFSGSIPTTVENLSRLEYLDLSINNISGKIPKSLFLLPAMQNLYLSSNQFSSLEDIPALSSSPLFAVELDNNNIKGPIPNSFFQLKHLVYLDLSSNRFSGTVELSSFCGLMNLIKLSLSHNMLTIVEDERGNTLSSFPDMNFMELASCNLKKLPGALRYLNKIWVLDLSSNQIDGVIPSYIWKNQLKSLNLSNNMFTSLERSPSLVHMPELSFIDLSFNRLQGTIPSYIIESEKLSVLNLRANQLHGMLPGNITGGCKFETIDLNGNQLEGKIPRSLSNCQDLQVLDVGNNQITGSFPSWLGVLPHLRVLVLRSNQLNGTIEDIKYDPSINIHFTSLQILDLASNHFSGKLPKSWFSGLKAMMITDNNVGQVLGHYTDSTGYYQDTISIIPAHSIC